VLFEHRQMLLFIDKLFSAINARNMTQVDVINRTEVDPLFEQMDQQVDSYGDYHSEEVLRLLALLEQTQQRNFIIMPTVFAIGFLIIGVLWSVLCSYQRRVDDARQAEMAQLEEIARVKTVQLDQQRRLTQLKDQFIANVSHELRTPLTAVYGYVELLHEHWECFDTAVQTRFVCQIKQGCEDLLMLINSILETTIVERDLGELSLKPTPVSQVVQEVLTGWDPRDLQVHTLEVDLPEHVVVWADRQALQQVLRNLLSNACKYAPKQSAISIRAKFDEQVEDTNAPGQVCIRMQDAGPGIPPDECPLLFQKFVRLKRDLSGTVRGTGLGLYISRQLIEAMNGQIWVESSGKPGEGSCFCFTLPSTAMHPRAERLPLGA
jgi:signal transduction histidine kinase